MSFFAPYLRGLGFSGEQLGALWSPAQIAAAPAALLWGTAADRFITRPRALVICTLGAASAMAGLPFARTPFAVGALLFGHAIFNAGTIPLVDSLTMEAGASYPRVRLFGSVGFVVVAEAAGLVLSARGNLPADGLVPASMFALVAGTAATAAAIALQRQPVMEISPASSKAHLRDVARLFHGALPVLLLVCAVHWAACAPYHLLFGVLVRDLGLGADLTGMGMALGVVAEVAVLFAFPVLARRYSLRALLAVSFATTAVRWALVSRATSAAELVLLQLLHGATFGLWWGASVQAMGRLVPTALRATGQALFSAVVFGAGNAIGFALSGAGYDRFGGAPKVFAVGAAVEMGNLVLLAVATRWRPLEAKQGEEGGPSPLRKPGTS
jgi:PPP family 3-phenylpropionic acid transporter